MQRLYKLACMCMHGIVLLEYVTIFSCIHLFLFVCLCGCRSESAAIPSPHHLAWLTLETYKTLFPDDKVHQSTLYIILYLLHLRMYIILQHVHVCTMCLHSVQV